MSGNTFLVLFLISLLINIILMVKIVWMHKKLHTNPLTGLPNIKGLERTRRKQRESEGAMLYLDLDNFKKINDEYGHHAGDEVIKLFGDFLKHQIRSTDKIRRFNGEKDDVAHLHGDEFVIFLDGATYTEAKKVKKKIISNLAKEKFRIEGTDKCISIDVSTTIGVALFEESLKETMQQADAKMLAAKKRKNVSR